MKKKYYLLLALTLIIMGYSTIKQDILIGDNDYIVSEKDIIKMSNKDVIKLKIELNKDKELLTNSLKESISVFYDDEVDLDTLDIFN